MLEPKLKVHLRNDIPLILPEIQLKINLRSDDQELSSQQSQVDELNTYKDQINQCHTTKEWDRAKKLTNPFELIHIPNRKIKNESLSLYDPLSRSFFKLWELLVYFNLLDGKEVVKTAHFAEGPGGFMEAILMYRKEIQKYPISNDRYYGITLKPDSKEIPGWCKAQTLTRKYNQQIKIQYGDIYEYTNLENFRKEVGSADLITGDGGFDFSTDFNKQEQMATHLIFAEILGATMVQKIGGSFACKFFDTYCVLSIKLLYFLKCLYKDVYIIKPLTSRPANSEKYVFCLGYIGFDRFKDKYSKRYLEQYQQQLRMVFNKWNQLSDTEYEITDIFGEIPKKFVKQVMEYNDASYQQQVKYIKKTLEIIDNKPDKIGMNEYLKDQTLNAIEWCKSYKIPVNMDSYFYLKYYSQQTERIEGIELYPY